MKRLKFYKYLAITLLIINIGVLVFFLASAPPHPPRPGEHKISGDLGLEGAAKKKVDALEVAHHRDKRKLMKKDFELHRKLYQNLESEEKAAELLKKIQENRIEIEAMTYEFFHSVSENCNESQKKELKKFINQTLRMITNQPPKRP